MADRYEFRVWFRRTPRLDHPVPGGPTEEHVALIVATNMVQAGVDLQARYPHHYIVVTNVRVLHRGRPIKNRSYVPGDKTAA